MPPRTLAKKRCEQVNHTYEENEHYKLQLPCNGTFDSNTFRNCRSRIFKNIFFKYEF